MKKRRPNLMADLIPYTAEPEGEFKPPLMQDALVTLKLPSLYSFSFQLLAPNSGLPWAGRENSSFSVHHPPNKLGNRAASHGLATRLGPKCEHGHSAHAYLLTFMASSLSGRKKS